MSRSRFDLVAGVSLVATFLVSLFAAIVSYRHLLEVARRAGEESLAAALIPLGVDGLILVGSLTLLADRRVGRPPRRIAHVAVWVGVVLTILGQLASADPHPVAWAVAVVPALTFLITVHVVLGRREPQQVSRVVSPPPAGLETIPAVFSSPTGVIPAMKKAPPVPARGGDGGEQHAQGSANGVKVPPATDEPDLYIEPEHVPVGPDASPPRTRPASPVPHRAAPPNPEPAPEGATSVRAQALALLAEGRTVREVAALVGRSQTAVRKYRDQRINGAGVRG